MLSMTHHSAMGKPVIDTRILQNNDCIGVHSFRKSATSPEVLHLMVTLIARSHM